MSETTTGVLDLSQKGDGFLRNPARSFQPSPDDVLVPRQAIQKFALVHGATITGPVKAGKRAPQLVVTGAHNRSATFSSSEQLPE